MRVTDVFVNDAKRGYGIFIQWMLERIRRLEVADGCGICNGVQDTDW